MKTFVEIVKFNVNDVITTSAPCGAGYTPTIGGGCSSGNPDDE